VLLLALGCVPPTVYGLRFDGTMAANSELSAGAAIFPDMIDEQNGSTVADSTVVGLEGRQRLGNDVTVALVAGTAPASLSEDSSAVAVGGLELQGRVLKESPVTVGIVGGLDSFMSLESPTFTPGVHLGAVVSRGVGGVRPYLGAQVNPVVLDSHVYPWFLYSGGISWRPPINPATRGLLLAEASLYQGLGVGWDGEAGDGTTLPASDIVTWSFLIQAGVSFGANID
jgi:hypothetical protein